MNRFFKLILLSPSFFTNIGCATYSSNTPIDVIIISGQSNAVGCTNSNCIGETMGYSKFIEYKNGYPEIKIAYDCWTKDFEPTRFYSQNKVVYGFENVKLGQGNGIGTFGPELGIAEYLKDEYSNKLYLIKFACGSSNLKDDWTKKDSSMYGQMIDFIKEKIEFLKNQGFNPIIKAFCWMQGEGDSYYGYYQHYYENLKEFVGNIRSDLQSFSNSKNIPFIDAGISNAPPWEYYKEVNEAKQKFASENENNIYIDTIGAGLHTDKEPFTSPDLCHYDSESELLLGKLFAENFKPFLEKTN